MMHLYLKKVIKYGGLTAVLILVVMDDALVLVSMYSLMALLKQVLILVVMDDALVLARLTEIGRQQFSLNPCCNG